MRPAKAGRHSSTQVNSVAGHVRRNVIPPKSRSCAFLCDNPTTGQLHLVQTDAMGERFF